MRVFCCFFLLFTLPAVVGAQWEPDRKLSTNEVAATLNENMGHCLIADGETLHAVWCDTNSDGSAIYYKRSTDGGLTWGPDTRISGTPSSDSFPLLALSGSTLHLVFLRDNGTDQSASYYKRSTDGGDTWGPDVFLGNTTWWPGVAAAGPMVYVSLNNRVDADNSEVYFRRSTDNGTTWEPQQQISSALGRSEDPAIAADGTYVHLVWNDNRGGAGMMVYYRRSSDMGVTWGPETALTEAPQNTYFPTIHLSGADVDISYGDRQTGNYDIYYVHSPDFGSAWGAKQQITQTPIHDVYPAVARDGSDVHLLWWTMAEEILYLHSGDGGAGWDPVVSLVGQQGSFPFVAVAGGTVHVIFVSKRDGHGAIYYKRKTSGSRLLRNTEWPGLSLPAIFAGPSPGCPASGPPGVSLDPWGPDCIVGSGDDDTYVRPFTAGTSDPDGSIFSDNTRPLVFYQYYSDVSPSACAALALTKDTSGGVRIDCR
jgi:hypothetical protein